MLRIFKSETGGAYLAVNRHHSGCSRCDIHLARGIVELQTDRARYPAGAGKPSGDIWARVTPRKGKSGREEQQGAAAMRRARHSPATETPDSAPDAPPS